jgi:hypothetical protein
LCGAYITTRKERKSAGIRKLGRLHIRIGKFERIRGKWRKGEGTKKLKRRTKQRQIEIQNGPDEFEDYLSAMGLALLRK